VGRGRGISSCRASTSTGQVGERLREHRVGAAVRRQRRQRHSRSSADAHDRAMRREYSRGVDRPYSVTVAPFPLRRRWRAQARSQAEVAFRRAGGAAEKTNRAGPSLSACQRPLLVCPSSCAPRQRYWARPCAELNRLKLARVFAVDSRCRILVGGEDAAPRITPLMPPNAAAGGPKSVDHAAEVRGGK
jgi:hypothetical protein